MLAALGVALLTVTLFDLAWTTVAPGAGGGPMTRRIGSLLWRVSLGVHRRRHTHRFLSAVGPVIVMAVFATWVLALLGGWWLVFMSSEGAVMDAATSFPADGVDRLYFAGYTMFTLGPGDFAPGSGLWQMATVAATASGLILVTLGITYLMPVASSVKQRRQLANQISALGDDAEMMVTGSWNGENFGMLADQLLPLISEISQLREHHLTYPVVDHFHADEPQRAAPLQLVHLARAVEALRLAVSPGVRPDRTVLDSLGRMLDSYLTTVSASETPAVGGEGDIVAPIDLEVLRRAGIPTVDDDDEYRYAVDSMAERRAGLTALLSSDGWALADLAAS